MYLEYTKLCTFLSWIYIIVYTLWKIVYVEYTKLDTFLSWIYIIVYTLWKIVYVKYIELCIFFEKLCIFFDGVSLVHSLKNCVYIGCIWDSLILLKLKTFCWMYYRGKN